MYRISGSIPLEEEIRGLFVERVDESLASLDTFMLNPESAVHEIRKNLKRSRALLKLARRALDAQEFQAINRKLRDTGRMFALLRDATVRRETWTEVFDGMTLPAAQDALAALTAEEQALYSDRQGLGVLLEKAENKLVRVRARLAAAPLRVRPDDILEEFAGAYGRARRAMRRAGDSHGTPEDFHEWRKRVKDLWYQHELLLEMRKDDSGHAPRTEALQRLSELLGSAHDAALLARWLSGQPSDSGLLHQVQAYRADRELAALAAGEPLFRAKQAFQADPA